MPPIVFWALSAAGGAALVRWAAKEVRRINAELERARDTPVGAPAREQLPQLRRDPKTGVYRPN